MTRLIFSVLLVTLCAPPGGAQSPGWLLQACPFLGGSFFPQTASATPEAVTIVLPPRVVAGEQATLAVLDGEGRLLPDVSVELAGGEKVKTDPTGRASFAAPSSGSVLLAKAAGASAAALVDAVAPAIAPNDIKVPPVLSLHDRFSICGASFRGDADANRIALNGVPALVLAASPECVVALPAPTAQPGPAKISFEIAGVAWASATAVVSLEFAPPDPPLALERTSSLRLRVEGSASPLDIMVENQTPDVLRFLRGDTQELRTSGGVSNSAAVAVRAIRSGDFSFHARLARIPDPETARRFVAAAETLAPGDARSKVNRLAEKIARHSGDIAKVRRELDNLLAAAASGDFRALLAAARSAL